MCGRRGDVLGDVRRMPDGGDAGLRVPSQDVLHNVPVRAPDPGPDLGVLPARAGAAELVGAWPPARAAEFLGVTGHLVRTIWSSNEGEDEGQVGMKLSFAVMVTAKSMAKAWWWW